MTCSQQDTTVTLAVAGWKQAMYTVGGAARCSRESEEAARLSRLALVCDRVVSVLTEVE